MNRLLLAAAALLLAAPAQAQSFYPNTAGSQFCMLRRAGVSTDDAIRAAVRSNYSSSRDVIYVTQQGRQISTDAIEFAHYIGKVCPQYGSR